MNLKEIKEMIALMNENNLTELELEREGLKIRLRRSSPQDSEQPNIFIERLKSRSSSLEYSTDGQGQPIPPESGLAADKQNLIEIKAPMVGTFYRSPSPEAAPFVEKGAEIEIGQVICIIEAMKLMNEIKSEVKGIIQEILIENGNPIEYGQVLFRIKTK